MKQIKETRIVQKFTHRNFSDSLGFASSWTKGDTTEMLWTRRRRWGNPYQVSATNVHSNQSKSANTTPELSEKYAAVVEPRTSVQV